MARITKEDIVALKYDGLVDKIEEVERRIFHKKFSCDPKELYNKLLVHQADIIELRSKSVINREKYKLLFPPSGETDSKTLDVTTMHALLRNFGGYSQPATGWDREPVKTDRSEIANLIRLNLARHEGRGHLVKFLRTNSEFKKLHQKLKQPFLELGCSKDEIDDLLRFKGSIKYKFIPPVPEFIARKGEITQIHSKMQSLTKSASKMGLVVHAFAGVGKSQVSKKYFQEYAHFYNDNVIWINANTLEDSFRELGEFLKIKVKDERGHYLSTETIIKDVHNYLADDKVLFIFDNADDVSHQQIMKYLPMAKQNFSLITSQLSKWPSSHFETFSLQVLTEDESMQFARQELKMGDEPNELLIDIVKVLDGHLLALKHFTTYINETGTSLKDYLVLIREQPNRASVEGDQTVIHAVNINITRLTHQAREENNHLADHILHSMRFLNGKEMSRGFFFCLKFDQATKGPINRANVNKALYSLEKYSLISINKSPTASSNEEDLIIMHSLVQKTLRILQEEAANELERYRYILTHFVHDGDEEFLHMKKIKFNEFKFWYHQLIYVYNDSKDDFRDEFLKFFDNHVHFFTDVLTNRCEFSACNKILDELLGHKICRENLRSSYKVHFCKGIYLTNMKEHERAIEIYKEVLEKQQGEFGVNDRDYLRTSLEYGRVLLFKYHDFESCLQHMLKLNEAQLTVLGENHFQTLACQAIIAVTKNKKAHSVAIQELQLVMEKQSELYEEPHPALCETRDFIASFFGLCGKKVEAKKDLVYNIKACQEMYEATHPNLTAVQVDFAMVISDDKSEDSREIFQNSLASIRLVYGEEHRKVIGLKFLLATTFRKQGKLHDELALLSEIVSTLEKTDKRSIHIEAFMIESLMRQNEEERAYNMLQEILDSLVDEHKDANTFKTFQDLVKDNKVVEAGELIHKYIPTILFKFLI